MEVYNESKTKILTNYDLSKGYLKDDKLVINHPEIQAVKEQGHYEVIAEYENGGKDVKWVVDVAGVEYQPARTEEKDIVVYIPYTNAELVRIQNENELNSLLNNLYDTDYIANKLIEAIDETEREQLRQQYAEILSQRRTWRARASELKDLLK